MSQGAELWHGAQDMLETGSACNSIMSTRILNEKRARRIAEDDALKLYNRVRQLQKEEERAQKRIVDTKRKAKDIVKYRERNEKRLEEKELRQKQLAEEVELLKIENLKAKEESLKARAETETKLYADKVAAVRQTKDEKAELERLVAENRLLQRQKAFEAKETVRKSQQEAESKMQVFKTAKLQMVRPLFLQTMSVRHLQSAPERLCCVVAGPGRVREEAEGGGGGADTEREGDREAGVWGYGGPAGKADSMLLATFCLAPSIGICGIMAPSPSCSASSDVRPMATTP
jgi:hypothetical protein